MMTWYLVFSKYFILYVAERAIKTNWISKQYFPIETMLALWKDGKKSFLLLKQLLSGYRDRVLVADDSCRLEVTELMRYWPSWLKHQHYVLDMMNTWQCLLFFKIKQKYLTWTCLIFTILLWGVMWGDSAVVHRWPPGWSRNSFFVQRRSCQFSFNKSFLIK